MRSTIVLNEKKELYVSVRMEELFLSIKSGVTASIAPTQVPHLSRKSHHGNYLSRSLDRGWWNTRNNYQDLFGGIQPLASQYADYTWYFDFEDMETLHPNALAALCDSTNMIKKKYIANYHKLNSRDVEKLLRHGFCQKSEYKCRDFYADALREHLFNHIQTNCRAKKPFPCLHGETITNYIELKSTLEDNTLLFQISFLLSKAIAEQLPLPEEREDCSLFCHSLNGACLAENISLILGMNVVYADRLNATGNVRKLFMPDRFEKANKCIVVTDLICQGHEILRAKDIVMMLGGEILYYIGVVDMGFISESEQLKSDNFVFRFNKEDREKLEYQINLGGNS